MFKKRRLNARILSENAEAEAQLTSTGKILKAPLMVAFVRARTGETVQEKGAALKARVEDLRQKPPSAIQLGLEPAAGARRSPPPRALGRSFRTLQLPSLV